ncbi:MAG: hypothetical protein EPO24_02910, partial [Bacteroidetes bacterium]
MNTIPSLSTIEPNFSLPNFTLVTASAGSGKTHALTLRFAQILLSTRIPHNRLPNILAITFTNNAAAEMKQRILEYLKCAYLGIEKPELLELRQLVSLDDQLFRRRAGECIATILDQYSDFQVQTIDSFIIRLLKASAVEFGFSPRFDVSFALAPAFNESLEIVSREITRDPATYAMLKEIALMLAENQRPGSKFLWNPFTRLFQELVPLSIRINSHKGEPAEEYWVEIKARAAQAICDGVIAVATIARNEGVSLTRLYSQLVDLATAGNIELLIGRTLDQKALLKSKGAAYDRAVEQVERTQEELRRNIALYLEAKARTYYLPYALVHRRLTSVLERIRHRRGEVQLSEANKLLANRINEEFVPEVFFALGERIHHYLIDEFQDTAPIQWSALHPLIENSLAQEGSLFLVGDMKQSIYAFRGADWQIMKRMTEREEFLSVQCDRKELTVNWRSSEAVVRFVKHVFQEIIPRTDAAETAALSGLTSFHQEVRAGAKGTGYAEMSLFEEQEEDEAATRDSPQQRKLLTILVDCINRGYSYGDIAILTPNNEHVIEVSRWLNNANIAFMSHSSLDIRTRRITGEILALLKFLDSPVNDLAFATFITGDIYTRAVSEKKQPEHLEKFLFECRSINDSYAPLYTQFRLKYPDLWSLHFERLFTLTGYLPVYDLIAEIYSCFDVFRHHAEEEATLVRLAEVMKEFEAKGSNSLKDFLAYSTEYVEGDEWNIERSSSADAVTVMTVHKAKGLGFPVVIALLYDGRPRPDNISVEEQNNTLRLARTTKEWANKSAPIQELYRNIEQRSMVDSLNKLYVALTRAREEMFVLCVKRPGA